MIFKIWMPSEHAIRAGQYTFLSKLLMTMDRTGITESLELSDEDSVMLSSGKQMGSCPFYTISVI